ncbi:MAG: hypothetical protein OHK0012_25020 [Synechococcales cyanobacterium]
MSQHNNTGREQINNRLGSKSLVAGAEQHSQQATIGRETSLDCCRAFRLTQGDPRAKAASGSIRIEISRYTGV